MADSNSKNIAAEGYRQAAISVQSWTMKLLFKQMSAPKLETSSWM